LGVNCVDYFPSISESLGAKAHGRGTQGMAKGQERNANYIITRFVTKWHAIEDREEGRENREERREKREKRREKREEIREKREGREKKEERR